MRRFGRWVGVILGAIFLAAGVAAVIFVDFSPTPPPPRQLVRPVKSALAISADTLEQRRFRGEVVPGKTVDLAFQIGGQIIEGDLSLGRQVAQGELVAKLDITPMEQKIAVLEPTVTLTTERLDQIRRLVEKGAATAGELADAQAAYDKAVAELRIAQQALADAVLAAPFDSLIVQRFYDLFENIQAGQPVVRLQDISSIDIRVELPESVVARHRGDRPGRAEARFAALAGRSFPVTVKEASAEANAVTGGYPVTYTMPAPEGATILPGMGATIVLIPSPSAESQNVSVPAQAIVVDATGGRWVWRLKEQGPVFVAAKVPVTVTELTGDQAIISEGLQDGWRVAVAGVHFLGEGQAVRLMEQDQ